MTGKGLAQVARATMPAESSLCRRAGATLTLIWPPAVQWAVNAYVLALGVVMPGMSGTFSA